MYEGPDMVVHNFNPKQRQVICCEFQASLVYIESSGQLVLHKETLSQKSNKKDPQF